MRRIVLFSIFAILLTGCASVALTSTATPISAPTATPTAAPAAQSLPVEVDQRIREIEGVHDVHVAVTWTPPWDKSKMSEVAQLELGWL